MANTLIIPPLTGLIVGPQTQQFQGDNVSTTITFPVSGTVPTAFTLVSARNSSNVDVSGNFASQSIVGNTVAISLTNPFPDIYTIFYTITQPPSAVPPLNVTLVSGTVTSITNPIAVGNFPALQPVSGTFWQATQPISAATLPLPTGASQQSTYTSFAALNPAPGAGATITVPAGQQWIIHGVRLTFVTSATAGNRTMSMAASDASAHVLTQVISTYVQPASTTTVYAFASGAIATTVPVFFTITQPQPAIYLGAGGSLVIAAVNEQAADQISTIALMIEMTT